MQIHFMKFMHFIILSLSKATSLITTTCSTISGKFSVELHVGMDLYIKAWKQGRDENMQQDTIPLHIKAVETNTQQHTSTVTALNTKQK